ncbi:prolyl oligopeptidase family serine peptidase [Listeria booriae]|uniref:prolyl oligopeptidase family serine peptidase n=1 Tax=Listeria booriae TaxID=1552123 RepID=UPI0016245E9F|nr:prolyl oligopeptidase family serine peptidase [Listeria booriae]MBC1913050.1 prolyl oligopeptidase family serine peptidase [Listeria booriae]
MKKRYISFLVLVLVIVASACSNNSKAETKLSSKDITLVTQVIDKGEVGAAVILTYSDTLTGSNLNQASFSVFAGDKSRTIKAIYTSEKAEVGTPTAKGKYVILELDPNDSNASTLTFDIKKFVNTRTNLAYTVKQNKSLTVSNKDYSARSPINIKEIASPDLDMFQEGMYTEGKQDMAYRLFEPVKDDTKKPLVVFLHGSGERGNDNKLQLLGTDGPVTFAAPTFQGTTPSYVLAPQVAWDEERNGWFADGQTETVKQLIDSLLVKYKDIDTSRIYITGVSNGGTGTWKMIVENPNFFAAAVPIAGYMYHKDATFITQGTARYLAPNQTDATKIKNMPIWAFQAEDDPVNSVNGSLEAVAAIKKAGSTFIQMTEYPSGLVAPNPHASWEKAYNNAQLLNWLISQHK